MSIEETEQAAFGALLNKLPAAIEAENLKYAPNDPNLIPQVQTWRRGLIVQLQDIDVKQFPIVVVGCYKDTPMHDNMEDYVDFGEWGSEIERPVICLVALLASTENDVHIRLVRMINAIKNVWRSEAKSRLSNAVKYWPLDLDIEFDEPQPLPIVNGDVWIQVAKIEAARCVVIEGITS